MNQVSKKMDVLMGLGISSIVQIDSVTAMLKLPPSWECMIDVSTPTYNWIAKSDGVSYDWQNSEVVPDEIKENIRNVTARYNDALMDMVVFEE